jgi:hypothetical protein
LIWFGFGILRLICICLILCGLLEMWIVVCRLFVSCFLFCVYCVDYRQIQRYRPHTSLHCEELQPQLSEGFPRERLLVWNSLVSSHLGFCFCLIHLLCVYFFFLVFGVEFACRFSVRCFCFV